MDGGVASGCWEANAATRTMQAVAKAITQQGTRLLPARLLAKPVGHGVQGCSCTLGCCLDAEAEGL